MINKLLTTLLLATLQLAVYSQQTYRLNIKKSKILWDAHNSIGKHNGYLLLNSGTLNYSATDQPEKGMFNLNMLSMRATDDKRPAANKKTDEALTTFGFFNTQEYPAGTMNVKQITRAGNATTFKVMGNLTIKGITRSIEFLATITKSGNVVNAVAQTKIDRHQWNIDLQEKPKAWDVFQAMKSKMMADDIAISLNLVFNK